MANESGVLAKRKIKEIVDQVVRRLFWVEGARGQSCDALRDTDEGCAALLGPRLRELALALQRKPRY